MPRRTDKIDAMRLSASLTGFQFDIIEGVSGADNPTKALPGVSFTTSTFEAGLTTGQVLRGFARDNWRNWLLALTCGFRQRVRYVLDTCRKYASLMLATSIL
jgi:hypothetical protein